MQRFSTVAALDMQLKIVEPVFDKIYSAIFDTTKPIRTSRLSGIQLVDNLNPKEKKTKGKADSLLKTQPRLQPRLRQPTLKRLSLIMKTHHLKAHNRKIQATTNMNKPPITIT